MAHMTTQLAWGAISFQQGYENACQLEYIKETIKWATDYFIDANRLPDEFIGQVGAGDADHSYWGRAEDMNMHRPVYSISPNKPGSDLASETAAAALAAASIFYDNVPNIRFLHCIFRLVMSEFRYRLKFRGLCDTFFRRLRRRAAWLPPPAVAVASCRDSAALLSITCNIFPTLHKVFRTGFLYRGDVGVHVKGFGCFFPALSRG